MQVILLERVAKLGQMGDIVDTRPGYARNYLLPKGKALLASQTNIKKFEDQKAQLEARNLETRKEAENLADRIAGSSFVIIRSASEGGNLYGSVNSRDAAESAKAAGFLVDRKQIVIEKPIKELGLHKVIVYLHPEVTTGIILNVARSEAEAEIQASGKTIQDVKAEEEAASEAEIAELFDEIGVAQLDEENIENLDIVDETAKPKEIKNLSN